LCLNCVAYGLTLGQNKLIFKYLFFVYGLGWLHIRPKDIWLMVFARHLF
jgi:hypothetical protein